MKILKHLAVGGLALAAGGVALALVTSSKPQEAKAASTVYLDNTITVATADSETGRYWNRSTFGTYLVNFNLPAQMFASKYYVNDHLNDAKDRNGNTINLGDGILINDKTLRYWTTFNDGELVYPRTDGLLKFPLSAGGVQSPVNLYLGTTRLQFMLNRAYFPMDSIKITFKAGVFAGYHNDTDYVLNNDLTFHATLNTTAGVSNSLAIDFSKNRNEVTKPASITSIHDLGEKTAAGGAKYHTYQLWTNIPQDTTFAKAFPVENYVYMLDNVLMNGKTLAYYMMWGRGNSKDFTDLNDATTQVADYEMQHPTGSANTKYDYVVQASLATDRANHVIAVNVPNQLKTDFSMGDTPTFAIRDGSAWHSFADDGTTPRIVRANRFGPDYDAALDFVNGYMHMDYDAGGQIGSTGGNGSCVGYFAAGKDVYLGLSDEAKLQFVTHEDFEDAAARWGEWARINGYTFNATNGALSSQSVKLPASIVKERTSVFAMFAALSAVAIAGTAAFIIRKKKRG